MYNDLLEVLKAHIEQGHTDLNSLSIAEQLNLAIAFYKGIDKDRVALYGFLRVHINDKDKEKREFFNALARNSLKQLMNHLEKEYQKLRQGGQTNG